MCCATVCSVRGEIAPLVQDLISLEDFLAIVVGNEWL